MPNSGHAEVRAAGVFPSSTKVMAVELSEVAHGWRRYPRAFSRCEMRAQLSTRLKRDLPMNPVFWLNSFVIPPGHLHHAKGFRGFTETALWLLDESKIQSNLNYRKYCNNEIYCKSYFLGAPFRCFEAFRFVCLSNTASPSILFC
jgi:hypothetical protein